MRGTCNILVKRSGAEEECGKPSVYSKPCQCDICYLKPGYHLPEHWCAEHYDRLMNPPKGPLPADCPKPDSTLEVL